MTQHQTARAFTLMELAVVLVIIGLVAGGIMLGQSILVNARMQSVITDVDMYTTAVTNFRKQYLALPGDLNNATTNWGTDSSGCPSGGGSTGTCNGNADNKIGAVASYENESFRLWQHLYGAGMFPDRLSGVAVSGGTYHSKPGVNIPAIGRDGGIFVGYWGYIAGSANQFDGFYGNVFLVGKYYLNNAPYSAFFTPAQAQSIDAKMDDGIPATGKVRAFVSTSTYNPGCTTTAVASTSLYALTATTPKCSLTFVMGF